jgi:hypothetical protein
MPDAVLLDFNDILRDPVNGGILPQYTDDGVHTNLLAVTRMRQAMGRYGLTERRGLPHKT